LGLPVILEADDRLLARWYHETVTVDKEHDEVKANGPLSEQIELLRLGRFMPFDELFLSRCGIPAGNKKGDE